MLAAVEAADEQLIALQYQVQVSAHLAFFSVNQKDDSHWRPSLDCMVGVNGICCKSSCTQKTNNRALFITGCFNGHFWPYLMFINNVTVRLS